jgi:hypothetical protein
MESILTDILMKVSDVLTQKTTLRVSDVLTHPGQRCPDISQLAIKISYSMWLSKKKKPIWGQP